MAFRVACQLTSRLTSISPCVGWVWALFHVLKLQGILQGRSIVPKVFNLTTFAFSLCKKYSLCTFNTFIRTGGLGSFKLILQIYTGSHNIFISNLGGNQIRMQIDEKFRDFPFLVLLPLCFSYIIISSAINSIARNGGCLLPFS